MKPYITNNFICLSVLIKNRFNVFYLLLLTFKNTDMKKEILTEDILDKCKEYDQEARQEIFDRLDMTLEFDLPFGITERVFFWFVDNSDIYEEPDIDDIARVVERDYLHRE